MHQGNFTKGNHQLLYIKVISSTIHACNTPISCLCRGGGPVSEHVYQYTAVCEFSRVRCFAHTVFTARQARFDCRVVDALGHLVAGLRSFVPIDRASALLQSPWNYWHRQTERRTGKDTNGLGNRDENIFKKQRGKGENRGYRCVRKEKVKPTKRDGDKEL